MTLCEVGSSCAVVVARASIECGVSGQKLACVSQSKRNRCCEEHHQDNPVCAFHGEGRPMRPNRRKEVAMTAATPGTISFVFMPAVCHTERQSRQDSPCAGLQTCNATEFSVRLRPAFTADFASGLVPHLAVKDCRPPPAQVSRTARHCSCSGPAPLRPRPGQEPLPGRAEMPMLRNDCLFQPATGSRLFPTHGF